MKRQCDDLWIDIVKFRIKLLKTSGHKHTDKLTQLCTHKPQPAKHRCACGCVYVYSSLLLCVCESVQKGTLWCESSSSDCISSTLTERSQWEGQRKLNALRWPKNWTTPFSCRQADSGNVTKILLKRASSLMKTYIKPERILFVMCNYACQHRKY